MKKVPYRCRFGHVTIVTFYPAQPTLGTTECIECTKLIGLDSKIPYNAMSGGYNYSTVKRAEKAVRI